MKDSMNKEEKNLTEEKESALIARFLRYVRIDTQSDEKGTEQPSTAKQRDLASLLVKELRAMGAETVYDERHCYVYASVPGDERPPVGFISHMDTSPAVSGANVKPRIIHNYDGHDPLLKTEEFPELLHHIGEDLIATDGTTLLGADDKAGVAEIMNLAEFYLQHPEIPHRPIRIAFTPDEEIGRGTEHFDRKIFGAKEAYTVDGGKLGVLEYECFNAAAAKVDFYGKSVHTGDAKNVMVNAILLAMEFQNMLPPAETPEHTEGYEGFYHLDEISGNVEHCTLQYIIRDHDRDLFLHRKQFMKNAASYMEQKYGEGRVRIALKDQYYNMAGPMQDHMDLVDRAKMALRAVGAEPSVMPIRGGTDGAVLTYEGIPCPNLCTGGYNYHGRCEYASIPEMEKTAEMLIELVKY